MSFLDKRNQLPDDCTLHFDTDDDGYTYCNASVLKKDDMSMLVFKLYNRLYQWACMPNYALYKRNYLLEKENKELKKKMKDRTDMH